MHVRQEIQSLEILRQIAGLFISDPDRVIRNRLLDGETILQRIGTLPANETSPGELRERWLRIMKKA